MITFSQLGKYGRFGNQLFQVASTIGIAEVNNQQWCFPDWKHPFKHDFNCNHFPIYSYQKVDIPWGYHKFNLKQGNFDIYGYLQSEKYFSHCEDLIRELFTFKEDRRVINDFIAVHVRRGDYISEYYTLLGRDYYSKALSHLPKLPVYVFTDDMNQAQKIVKADVYFTKDHYHDLNLMTKAKHHVIANSSFSWWGAWLADSKQVIAPKSWFGPKSPFNTNDLIPDRWIQL